MKTAARIDILAPPPTPCERTAAATNGTVTDDAPPISTGFRPSSAVMGAVRIEVNSPSIGGSPISDAIASPYGRAISAARKPPPASPQKAPQVYPRSAQLRKRVVSITPSL